MFWSWLEVCNNVYLYTVRNCEFVSEVRSNKHQPMFYILYPTNRKPLSHSAEQTRCFSMSSACLALSRSLLTEPRSAFRCQHKSTDPFLHWQVWQRGPVIASLLLLDLLRGGEIKKKKDTRKQCSEDLNCVQSKLMKYAKVIHLFLLFSHICLSSTSLGAIWNIRQSFTVRRLLFLLLH